MNSIFRNSFPTIKEHPFKVIAFDWDGTAVQDRSASVTLVTRAIEDVLKRIAPKQ